MFNGLWGGIANTLGHGANTIDMIYGDKSGLTDKKMQAEFAMKKLEAEERARKGQNQIIIISVIVMVIGIIAFITLRKK